MTQQFSDNQTNTFSLKYFVTPPSKGEEGAYNIFLNQDYFGITLTKVFKA